MNDTRQPEALPMPTEHPPGPPRAVPDRAKNEARSEPGQPDRGQGARGAASESAPAEEDIEQVRAQRDQYVEALRRLTAEFDNYRKRMLREQTAHVERAEEGLLRRLLPVLDAVELGADHHPDVLGPVHRQLQQTLAAEGLERVEPVDTAFDPAEHQAVEHDSVVPLRRPDPARDDDAQHGLITEVLRAGYRFHRRLLRPALVRVHS